ncbi:M28 family peptidase [Gilvibacter sp.]|uniref:M28 family peptidase n=1 Tax=Gilvibacter sp. TaxID=2729997 RepID=UPI0025C33A51|nr:M28 family peptidase [Gilvibacter sp.]NQX78785.1 M28 family peptidase [Gilvibacter sp.]
MRKTLSILCLFLSSLSLHAQDEVSLVNETTDRPSIEGPIYFLADDFLKGRETGTAENDIAASYLANQLRGYGAQPDPATGSYLQAVPMQRSFPPESIALAIGGDAMTRLVAMRQADISYDGAFIFMGYGLEQDYQGKDVQGKMVLVRSGSETANSTQDAFDLVSEKIELATSKGALGVVELLDANDQIWGFIEQQFNGSGVRLANNETEAESIPFVWIQDIGHSRATALAEKDTHSGSLNMVKNEKELFNSYNVVGWIQGTDPELKDEFIIYSGHYDHVGVGAPDGSGDTIYNGARDNAVGVTTVLSMAKNLAKYPTKRSALFILFTGEEKGLLGSRYYVDHPVLPLNQMVYCFNSDNAGYNNTDLATIVGLARTTAKAHIVAACKAYGLEAVDDPTADSGGLFDRSDNVNFARKGIPAPTFSLGFDAFDGQLMKYYHRPADEADGLNFDYLEKFFKSYVLAGRLIGNDPKTPVWIAGDKYEEASKELYGN